MESFAIAAAFLVQQSLLSFSLFPSQSAEGQGEGVVRQRRFLSPSRLPLHSPLYLSVRIPRPALFGT